jgi:hypothetical protein
VTERHVQDLLHESGATFSARVLELRLQEARSMLSRARYDGMKIIDIALACGFNEVSYFNRCFRRRFGGSPTEYRAQCPRGRLLISNDGVKNPAQIARFDLDKLDAPPQFAQPTDFTSPPGWTTTRRILSNDHVR